MELPINKRTKQLKRPQTLGEEIANAVSHGVVALMGIWALVVLILASTTGVQLFSSIIYGISIITLFLLVNL